MTHSTVGRRIKGLEAALGTKLFERTAAGFLLTDSGEVLLREAEGIEAHVAEIDELDLCITQLKQHYNNVSNTVRQVAAVSANGSTIVWK